MAYGRGDKKTLKRAVSLGTGHLTDSKLSALSEVRRHYIEAANQMLEVVFPVEPLVCNAEWFEHTEKTLLKEQKTYEGLNKGYVEKARIEVKKILEQCIVRYGSQLVGRLAHSHEQIKEKNKDSTRLYYYVPESVQEFVSVEELKALTLVVEEGGRDDALALFERVILQQDFNGLSENQVAIVQEIHRQVQERHRMPVVGRDPDFVCQIHLDARLIRSKETLKQLNEGAALLLDKSNACYKTFLAVSNPTPRAEHISIPLCMTQKAVRRLFKCKSHDKQGQLPNAKSLILELGPEKVEVKVVLSKKKPELPDLAECSYLMGRDFGYSNTITLSVAKHNTELSDKTLRKLRKMNARQAKKYLETHSLDDSTRVVERRRFSGKPFLGLIARHSDQIDNYKSQIDRIYNRIEKLKEILLRGLGYKGDLREQQISEHEVPGESLLARVHRRFFGLLKEVKHLKTLRKKLYRKIAAIKKSWFGFLSNQEIELLKTYKAALIRENLTVLAVEKKSDKYKGRTFNRMLNNGSKGQYIKRAEQKMLWNGVPSLIVPSYYTSSTCIHCGVVDKSMRSGEHFKCKECKRASHADENAADTLACYALLVEI